MILELRNDVSHAHTRPNALDEQLMQLNLNNFTNSSQIFHTCPGSSKLGETGGEGYGQIMGIISGKVSIEEVILDQNLCTHMINNF